MVYHILPNYHPSAVANLDEGVNTYFIRYIDLGLNIGKSKLKLINVYKFERSINAIA